MTEIAVSSFLRTGVHNKNLNFAYFYYYLIQSISFSAT